MDYVYDVYALWVYVYTTDISAMSMSPLTKKGEHARTQMFQFPAEYFKD